MLNNIHSKANILIIKNILITICFSVFCMTTCTVINSDEEDLELKKLDLEIAKQENGIVVSKNDSLVVKALRANQKELEAVKKLLKEKDFNSRQDIYVNHLNSSESNKHSNKKANKSYWYVGYYISGGVTGYNCIIINSFFSKHQNTDYKDLNARNDIKSAP